MRRSVDRREARVLIAALAISGALSGCSLIFDPERYQGGEAVDSGTADGSTPADDGGGDAGPGCANCDGEGEECIAGVCVDCDRDDDGYYGAERAECKEFDDDPPDCNDLNASIHPDALPICGDDVDQSCLGSSVAFFGLADELGAYPTREILLPAGVAERPRTVRAFVVGDQRVAVGFQNGDAHRTPYMVEFELSPENDDPVGDWVMIEDAIPGGPLSGTVRADLVRGNDGVLRGGLVGGDGGDFDRVALRRAFREPTWTPGERGAVSAVSLGVPGFQAQSPGALSVADGSLTMGIVGLDTANNQPVLLAVPLDSGALGGTVTRLVDARPRWVSSAGLGVVVPSAMGTLLYWGRRLDLGVDATVAMNSDMLQTPIANPVAAATVRGPMGDDSMAVALLPDARGLRAFGVQCTDPPLGMTGMNCMNWIDLPPPPAYEMPLASPIVGLARIFESRSALLAVIPGATEADDLRLALIETDNGLPTEISPLAIATEGAGVIREIHVDAWFVPQGAAMQAGQMTITYAYLREHPTEGRRLYVGAYRACAGFGGR